MIGRILVAIDGSDASQPVLEMGCALADRYDAKLGIVYVIEPQEVSDALLRAGEVEGVLRATDYSTAFPVWNYHDAVTLRQEARRSEAAITLATRIGETIVAEAKSFAAANDIKAIKTFVRSGDVADAILSVANDAKADLIAMGHGRRTGLAGLIHRSVAQTVGANAVCPCLVLSQ